MRLVRRQCAQRLLDETDLLLVLGFGEAALVPGWADELPSRDGGHQRGPISIASYFNAIGPVALGTAVTLAIAVACATASFCEKFTR